MSEIIFLVEEAPEGGYIARAMGESIFTEADDLNDLSKMVQDAVRCHFDDNKILNYRIYRHFPPAIAGGT
ncbi:2-oxoisovalerate dehydrogenase [bacterium]|nr:2-oxoisovalerate dehydrogenase [bacterium]